MFHFTFQFFGHFCHVRLLFQQRERALSDVFNLLCNQNFTSFLAVRRSMYRFTEVLFPVVNISIFKIVYIQFYWWKQRFYDSKVSSKDTHTYANSLRYWLRIIRKLLTLYSSITQALSPTSWFENKKQCFHSVSSFVMIALGLAKQVSCHSYFIRKVNTLQWHN